MNEKPAATFLAQASIILRLPREEDILWLCQWDNDLETRRLTGGVYSSSHAAMKRRLAKIDEADDVASSVSQLANASWSSCESSRWA